jgi:cytochrome c peroxidase
MHAEWFQRVAGEFAQRAHSVSIKARFRDGSSGSASPVVRRSGSQALTRAKSTAFALGLFLGSALMLSAQPARTAPGVASQTPLGPMELPVEVEIELSPAGSLKQAALWKELYSLLRNPYSITCTDPADFTTCTADEARGFQRRPGFGANMPPLNVYPLNYNFLTGQPMRVRTSDGEVSWDQPGPLYDPDEEVETDEFNTPTALRTIIGELVGCPAAPTAGDPIASVRRAQFHQRNTCANRPAGSLVVSNPATLSQRQVLGYAGTASDGRIPPHRTVVSVPPFNAAGQLLDDDGEVIEELEAPINEEDFFRTSGVFDPALQPYVGRRGAEVLGKSLFWDMQVGSDGVQACGTCHFHAGVDSRTRNQLNPNINFALEVASVAGSPTTNVEVRASDFPFHQRVNPDITGDGMDPAIRVRDANDVMSSMGVSRFRQFVDIPTPGAGAFYPAAAGSGVRALRPDIGADLNENADGGIGIMQGVRRIEPRNTPTIHGAAFNFDNFWDGRARFSFNGGSVFGPSDPAYHIFMRQGGAITAATNGDLRPDLEEEEPEMAEQPVRIKFSSLASQAVGPPLSDFEMSFRGRNWAKIGKKLLQNGVTPLASQLVAIDDSVLGPFSSQGGSVCRALGAATAPGRPGLCRNYRQLIQLAYQPAFHNDANTNMHLAGAPDPADPFDGYSLTIAAGPAAPSNTNQFTLMEANFSLLFALAVQAYEGLTIPDDTPLDRFFDANPFAGGGIGEPGDQAVLFPTLIPDLLDDGLLNGTNAGTVTLIPDDPTTPEYDGFGEDELFGFDIFAGGNLTAGLPPGSRRNPIFTITTEGGQQRQIAVGSNPFTRSAKCMLCHLGPEQTDHSINISHGVLKNDAEFEYPTPPRVPDAGTPTVFLDGFLPAPEPSGSSRTVPGLILEEEVGEGVAQDAVEVEPRNFATFDDPLTPWDDRVVAQPGNFAFGDQGVYNIGLRPVDEDIGRGGADPFGWPLSLAALTLKNVGGRNFEPCDGPFGNCLMADFDPDNIEAEDDFGNPIPGLQGFEETGDGAIFPGSTHTLQAINPGIERSPNEPRLPAYMSFWTHDLPAGELHPQIDEMAGFVPNTLTQPNGGPAIEYPEILFGADQHCALYDPAQFGAGPPNFGWGPTIAGNSRCPNNQSGNAGNHEYPSQGTWPVPNRVIRNGAFKAPPLRNVELTGPYFHTGSYLTLRQVVDFYMRGGDFPLTNEDNRDPHIVDINRQAFAFGRTAGEDLAELVDFGFLIGSFADGLPDPAFLYEAMPDTTHPISPEYASPESAKVALVRFLLALTDPRVKYERAPFDHPEIFVPIDGTAPENTAGRATLVSLSGVPCPGVPVELNPGPECFRQVPASGAGGLQNPLTNFLGISSTPVPGPNNDHFDR